MCNFPLKYAPMDDDREVCAPMMAGIEPTGALSQEGWRPIETAPRDGTPFLAFEPGNGEDFDMMRIAFRTRLGIALQEDDHLFTTATHWQPLPPPPLT